MRPIRKWLDPSSVAFASITVGLNLVNAPFNFFYVKVFLEVYGVRESHFQIAQVLFLVWNTANDPLFAYFLDKRFPGLCCHTRRASVMAGAPLLGLAFAITWVPWGPPNSGVVGAHLIASLSLYDSLFTFVALAQCAIFAEMSTSYDRRLDTKKYQVVGGLLVSWSVAFLNLVSRNLSDFRSFQLGCLVLAAMATVFVYLGGRHSSSMYDKYQAELLSEEKMESDPLNSAEAAADFGLTDQLRQIIIQRDFLAFVSTNFLQIFESAMWANFLSIFMEPLGPASPLTRSAAYLLVSVLPPLVILCGMPMIRHFGHHRAVLASLLFKVLAGPLVHLTGAAVSSPGVFAAYAVASSGFNVAAFSLFDLPLSELVDRDRVTYSRRLPLSSTVFGLNALITKPAISLAPLAVVALLNLRGYQTYRSAAVASYDLPSSVEATCPAPLAELMLFVACYLPAVVGCLQLVCWSFYRIRTRSI